MHSWIFRGGTVQDTYGIKIAEDRLLDSAFVGLEFYGSSVEKILDGSSMYVRTKYAIIFGGDVTEETNDSIGIRVISKSVIIAAPFSLSESTVDSAAWFGYGAEVQVDGGSAFDDEDEDETEDTCDGVILRITHTTP